jgi:RimJ/RimL family protein N-acetyltransferase
MPIIGPEPDVAPAVLETERLVLRPISRDDLPVLTSLADDEGVATMTTRMPYPFSLQDAVNWFDALVDPDTGVREIAFAITLRGDVVPFGIIGLTLGDGNEIPEVGFWLGRDYWNKGYMTEALGAVLDYAFLALGLSVVGSSAFPENAASIRVQEKLGFNYVGRESRPAPARGRRRDVKVYRITQEGWTDVCHGT